MNQGDRASDAAARGPAASEERIIAGAAEFSSTASKTTRFFTTIFQALLVAAVALWVLDIPRQVFNVAFYTEQLLAVCLGLTLALAYVSEKPKKPSAIDPSGAVAVVTILAYIALRHRALSEIPPFLLAGLGLSLIWTFLASRVFAARWFDWLGAAVSLVICAYIALRYEALTYEIALLPLDGIIGSAILIFLVLDASRRTSGWRLRRHHPGDGGLYLRQPVFSGRLPDARRLARAAGGLSRPRHQRHHRLDPVGGGADRDPVHDSWARCWRAPAAPSSSPISRCRRWVSFRGGAAKIAVVGSALFGMISGSAVCNVLAVGIVTIPTMIRSGFTPYRAAAIESVGSTGGQLMPPVMGASAFIMAEFLQVSYGAVAIAAAIPALLYYACLFIHVDLEAAKHKIGAAPDRRGADARRSVPVGLALPGADRVPRLFAACIRKSSGFTPEKTAIVATGILMVLTLIFGYRGKRTSIPQMLMAVIETGRVSLDIILIGAAAGIMVGILSISGLAFGMTLQLLALSRRERVPAAAADRRARLRARHRPADGERLYPDRDAPGAGAGQARRHADGCAHVRHVQSACCR